LDGDYGYSEIFRRKYISRKKDELGENFLYGSSTNVILLLPQESKQKLLRICVLSGGVILIGTGLILWGFPHNIPRSKVTFLSNLHTIIGRLLSLFLLVHIFLGIYMFDDFKAMFLHEKIRYEEAKEMAALWVEHEIIPLNK
jgi:formate dehydrogenase subunit gamma